MLHSKFSRFKMLTAAWFFVFGLLLSSCVTPNEDKEKDKTEEVLLDSTEAEELPIYGIWESTWGEIYVINASNFKNYYDGTNESYAGNSLRVQKTSDNSGFIYFKYTRSALPDWTYSEDAPDVGKWYAVMYKELTENTVFISGAYKADGKTSCKTVKEAINEFTVENGYYAGGSECVRTGDAAAATQAVESGKVTVSGKGSGSGTGNESVEEPEITVISTSYLKNFVGEYTLASGLKLNVGAKINISQDINHYWNANVVNLTYDENTKTYSFLLAHSSQKDASGSIDPGITGQEPFITQQGLFWSRMTLTAKSGSQWEIKWSSVWTSSMTDAASLSLDKTDSFTGPETTKIHYSYKFYFGNPAKDSEGWCTVDKGSLIYEKAFDSALPTDKTWKEIYEEYDIDSKINLPDGKVADYWWYSTKSITSNEESYVYKLSDNTKPSLDEYEFYLALKDEQKPVEIYTKNGKYYKENTGYLEIKTDSIQWNDDIYTIIDAAVWSVWTSDNAIPNRVAYLVSKDDKNYLCSVWYYINKPDSNNTYVNFELPLESNLTACPVEYDYTSDACKTGKNNKNLNKQDVDFIYPPISYPLYFTRSAFWMASGQNLTYNEGDEKADNSNYCFFILNDANSITWVTYPLVEDEENGDEYRERQEYSLIKGSEGLWELQDSASDSEDLTTDNVGIAEYTEGLELIISADTIYVDYGEHFYIKEWYSKVDAEPNTSAIIVD